ncbi:MAG: hypothetical protein LC790_20360 [Actinobacteria bacterium]|nr:hypothetical protein [Actinomycetota bacterium]
MSTFLRVDWRAVVGITFPSMTRCWSPPPAVRRHALPDLGQRADRRRPECRRDDLPRSVVSRGSDVAVVDASRLPEPR